MENQELKIEYIEVSKLVDYENNARFHDDAQIEDIENSIKAYGFKKPLLIDENFVIIAGHGRKLAAIGCGYKELPCIKVSDLSEDEKNALRIADNRIPQNASWDVDALVEEIGQLHNNGFDIQRLGFDDDELQKILSHVDVPIVDSEEEPDDEDSDEETTDIEDEEEAPDLDEQKDTIEPLDMVTIKINIPKKYKSKIKKYLAGDEEKTPDGMGKNILKKSGILVV